MNEIDWDEKCCGVFLVRCIRNKKTYVGKSEDVDASWESLIKELKAGKSKNDFLQKDWNRYGVGCFVFEVVEECSAEELTEQEIWWIKKLETYITKKGYNTEANLKEVFLGPDAPGIYSIKNMKNGRVYVGQSKNIAKRWASHRASMNTGLHSNKELAKEYEENKGDFVFSVLELCPVRVLDMREYFWIMELESHVSQKGYN